MSSDQPLSSRFYMSLLLSMMCFIIFACAESKPVEDASTKKRAEYEAKAKELRKSAEAGDASARNELGLLYYEGKGVPQDYRRAKEWFEEAAKQGNAAAQINIGTLYLHGEGAPRSGQMALFWFSRAADQRNALAFAKLGMMYAEGRGVVQDFIKAHMWYNLSAAQGENRSAVARDALAKQMTTAQIAEAQRLAQEWKTTMNKSSQTVH